MARVSIIVPTCGPNQWYEQCLDSIHAQTYKDIELIVVDDSARTGAAAARNRGLALANGEYVAFCDDDDTMEPDAVERLVAGAQDMDFVVGGFQKVGNFTASVTHREAILTMPAVASYVMGNLLNPRENQMFSGCWAKLYRRELIGRFPDLTTAEDMAFVFQYLSRCQNVRMLDGTVYNNRKRDGSLSTTFDERNKLGLFGFLGGLRYVERFLTQHVDRELMEDALDNSKVYHSMLYFLRICKSEGSDTWHTGEPMIDVFKRLYP